MKSASKHERLLEALRRINVLDRGALGLNAIPTLDKRACGAMNNATGPLSHLLVTFKDSFAVEGLSLSAGSPAFSDIVAGRDATVVTLLKQAGVLVLGKTNMPPVAIGGGQAGLHGTTKSPFNPSYLPAAWHSGSSIGSAVAVAAGMCDVGIGAETVSSGRSPASNNGLVAYTPSWGVISAVGNMPLHAYRDVPVPHVKDIEGLKQVIMALAFADPEDVWYEQRAISMDNARRLIERLSSSALPELPYRLRLGVPSRYTGVERNNIDGIPIRRSLLNLWRRTEGLLAEAGIETVPVDVPIFDEYEAREPRTNGFHPLASWVRKWTEFELGPLMTYSWTKFLKEYGDGAQLSDIDPVAIRPIAPDSTDLTYRGASPRGRDKFDFSRIVSSAPPTKDEVSVKASSAIAEFDYVRRSRYEDWLVANGLDGLVFPANTDVGPADARTNRSAAALAWRTGSVFSNGDHIIRRLGIPTVTLPMGVLEDIGMPVGITLCGQAWHDDLLVAIASRVEQSLPPRPEPRLTEPISDGGVSKTSRVSIDRKVETPVVGAVARPDRTGSNISIEISVDSARPVTVEALGRASRIEPGEMFRLEVSRSEWDEWSRPLAIVTEAVEYHAILAFAEIDLSYSEQDLVLQEV